MRRMKYRIYLVAALFLSAVSVSAQDLDPTVVVDRAYEGKLIEVHKPALEMAVPDSVLRFELDFDYSVFDNPYKGSYEFTPYLLSMKPSASADGASRFYLRAGAGYNLRPEFDMIWSPIFRNRGVGVDVYANHRSYIGKYHDLSGVNGYEPWGGNDLRSRAGVDFTYDWNKTVLTAGVGYDGIAASRPGLRHSYNGLDVSFALASRPKPYDERFMYAVKASYKAAKDNICSGAAYVRENLFNFNAGVGFATRRSMLKFDFGADFVNCSDAYKAAAAQFYVTPHYIYRKGRFIADLGVKISKIVDSDDQDSSLGAKAEQVLYPDVHMELPIIRNALKLKVDVTGGNTLNTYSSLLNDNHHLSLDYAMGNGCLLDYTVERINAFVGLEGRISSKFSYLLYGSAGYVDTALLEYVTMSEDGIFKTGIIYVPMAKASVGLDCMWKDESVMVDASLKYTFSESVLSEYVLMPAAVVGDIAVEYNWNRRLFVGVDCSYSSARTSKLYTMDAYADLGLYAEYATTRKLSFWGRGGNLLGMKIQRTPLMAEKGMYFTLGICLNL